MSIDYDVIVIGGGPAGSVVTTLLARRGMTVFLAERGSRGRDKTCGECLSPRGASCLRALGLDHALDVAAVGRTRAVRIHRADRDDGIIWPLDRHTPPGYLITRPEFDQTLRDLAQDAGAHVSHNCAARLERIKSGVNHVHVRDADGTRTLRTRLVIGADGLGSAVARAAGLVGCASAGRCFGFSLTLPPGDRAAGATGVIDMHVRRAGYLGVVRRCDGAVHCAALVRPTNGRISPRDFCRSIPSINEAMTDADRASTAIRAAGPMPWRLRQVAAETVALVGDAAGYVEPFTGEGITWALHSARLLSEVIDSASGQWNATTARAYERQWSQSICRAQRLCRWVSIALRYEPACRIVFAVMNRHHGLRQRIVHRTVAS